MKRLVNRSNSWASRLHELLLWATTLPETSIEVDGMEAWKTIFLKTGGKNSIWVQVNRSLRFFATSGTPGPRPLPRQLAGLAMLLDAPTAPADAVPQRKSAISAAGHEQLLSRCGRGEDIGQLRGKRRTTISSCRML